MPSVTSLLRGFTSLMGYERIGGRSLCLVTFLLVGTDDGVVPFVDGQAQPLELAGRRVAHLARARSSWWAIADDHTVVQRDAEGTWHDVATADARLSSLLPRPQGAICGTRDGRLLHLHEGRLHEGRPHEGRLHEGRLHEGRLHEGRWIPIEAFDEVEGRDTWHAVGSSVPYVRSLTVTADDRALLANVHVGGIPRSGNGGATWKPTIDPEADVHEVRAHPSDPNLVVAPAAVGVAVSHDAGVTWDVLVDGLHATYSRAVAFTTGAALVSSSDGPFTSQSALYRWDTAGGASTLERVTGGLPEWLDGNVDTGNLDAHGAACAFADESAVYASEDAGRSWSTLASDLGSAHGIGVHQ
jgi:hypothetical protein